MHCGCAGYGPGKWRTTSHGRYSLIKLKPLSRRHSTTPVTVGDGAKTLFWKDRWINGRSVAELAPCLINAVRPRTQCSRTVKEALQNRSWVRDIRGAALTV